MYMEKEVNNVSAIRLEIYVLNVMRIHWLIKY